MSEQVPNNEPVRPQCNQETETQNADQTEPSLNVTEIAQDIVTESKVSSYTPDRNDQIANINKTETCVTIEEPLPKQKKSENNLLLSEFLTKKTIINRSLTEPILMNIDLISPFKSSATIRTFASESKLNVNNYRDMIQMPNSVKNIQTESKELKTDSKISTNESNLSIDESTYTVNKSKVSTEDDDTLKDISFNFTPSSINSVRDSRRLPEEQSYRSIYLMEILSEISSQWDEWAKIKKSSITEALANSSSFRHHSEAFDNNPKTIGLKSVSVDQIKIGEASQTSKQFNQMSAKNSSSKLKSDITLTPSIRDKSMSLNNELKHSSVHNISEEAGKNLQDSEVTLKPNNPNNLQNMQEESEYVVKNDILPTTPVRTNLYIQVNDDKRGKKLRKIFKRSKYRIKNMFTDAGKKWDGVKYSVHKKISKYRLKQMFLQPLKWKKGMFDEQPLQTYSRKFCEEPYISEQSYNPREANKNERTSI